MELSLVVSCFQADLSKECLTLLKHAGFFGSAQADQAINGVGGPVR